VCDAATGGLAPDCTFVLDIPIDVSRARTAQRAGTIDRVEAEDDAFHQRVRQGFLALAAQPGRVLLDGRLEPAQLLEQTLTVMRDRFGDAS
jgi:dTMP kinase